MDGWKDVYMAVLINGCIVGGMGRWLDRYTMPLKDKLLIGYDHVTIISYD